MDDARKLLDSLMGNHRNVDRKEAAKRKGRNFLEDNICKHYLLGFCPQHEDLFHSTKRDIGKCQKVHSEAMKTEFENHPDHKKYRAQYEERLRHYLDELVRSAEEWASKERRNIKAENLAIEAAGPTELAKAEIKAMKDAAQTLLEDAEKLAESSRLEEAKKKTDEAKDFQQKAQEYEENAVKLRTEDVCDVCGSRMESGDPQFAKFRHIDGKIHVGFLKIREFLDGLKKRQSEREKDLGSGGRSRSYRRRSRSDRRRGPACVGAREGDRDRGGDQERERYQKDRDGGPHGERDRGGDQEREGHRRDRTVDLHGDRDRAGDRKRDLLRKDPDVGLLGDNRNRGGDQEKERLRKDRDGGTHSERDRKGDQDRERCRRDRDVGSAGETDRGGDQERERYRRDRDVGPAGDGDRGGDQERERFRRDREIVERRGRREERDHRDEREARRREGRDCREQRRRGA